MSDPLKDVIPQFLPASKKILPIFELVQSGSIALFAFFTAIMTGLTIFVSITTSQVVFEPLIVPSVFSDQGYSPEITTTRILDEVARINALSTSTKDKKHIGVKQPGDQLANLQALRGIDTRIVQQLVQELFGVKKETISGEITFYKENDRIIYQVRIRALPQNILLVDFKTASNIPEAIKEIALKLIEKLDPAVAASYYRWNKDIDNSLRLVDEALRNQDLYDDNYALVGRAQIYIARKIYELAQEDLDRVLLSDSKFAPALTTQALLFNEQKQYDKALEFALKAKAIWPERWQPYGNIGFALIGLGKPDEAEAAYISAINYSPTWPNVYDEIASFFIQRGKRDMAEQAYHKGLVKFPEQPDLLLHYGQFLLAANRKAQAQNYLVKAYRVTPDEIAVWAALLPLSVNTKDPILLEVREKAATYVQTKPYTPTGQLLSTLLKTP